MSTVGTWHLQEEYLSTKNPKIPRIQCFGSELDPDSIRSGDSYPDPESDPQYRKKLRNFLDVLYEGIGIGKL
jgi:hypothetical protein